MASAFEGNPVPPLLYTAAHTRATPIIHPPRSGYDPAGGLFIDETPTVRIVNPDGVGDLRYTVDGSIPTAASPIYEAPFTVDQTTVVQAAVFEGDRQKSARAAGYIRLLRNPAASGHGVRYRAYAVDNLRVLPDVSRRRADTEGTTYEISSHHLTLPRPQHVVVVFETRLAIDTPGVYTFTTGSDDGSKLFVNGREVVDNDGDHGVLERSGDIELTAGRHVLRVEWFNGGGGGWLGAYIQGPGVPRQIIPADRMFLK